jgi:hypothetical protein
MISQNKPWSWWDSRQIKVPEKTAILCETPLTFKHLFIIKTDNTPVEYNTPHYTILYLEGKCPSNMQWNNGTVPE